MDVHRFRSRSSGSSLAFASYFFVVTQKYFIGLTTIPLISFTAYVYKRPSTNRMAQKEQSILISSTDGQLPLLPKADTAAVPGGVCSFSAMTAKPQLPDTSSIYRTPVKRSKNIICSPKKLPMNSPMRSFSKYKEYHSTLYISFIEKNKLYAAAITNKNKIILPKTESIFIKLAAPWCIFKLKHTLRFKPYGLSLRENSTVLPPASDRAALCRRPVFFLFQGKTTQKSKKSAQLKAVRTSLNTCMAEREGFEPSIQLNTVYPLSRRAPSADSDTSPLRQLFYCSRTQKRTLRGAPSSVKQIFKKDPCRLTR